MKKKNEKKHNDFLINPHSIKETRTFSSWVSSLSSPPKTPKLSSSVVCLVSITKAITT